MNCYVQERTHENKPDEDILSERICTNIPPILVEYSSNMKGNNSLESATSVAHPDMSGGMAHSRKLCVTSQSHTPTSKRQKYNASEDYGIIQNK